MSNQYLIGRKVEFGYLLSAAHLTRNCKLTFSLEVTDTAKGKNSKRKGVGSSKGFSASKNQPLEMKQKKTFSAAELIFTTKASNIIATNMNLLDILQPVRGRLTNKVCDFLLPLLKCDLISIVGNIAYDIGDVRVFQDIPIVLNIFVDKSFFSRIEKRILDYSKQDGEMHVIESLHNMLLWLAGDSVIDNSADKKAIGTSSDLLSSSATRIDLDADNEDEANAEQQPTMNVDEIFDSSILVKPKSTESLQLPLLVGDIALKTYQVEAVNWMAERERDPSMNDLGTAALSLHQIEGLHSEWDGFLKEKGSSSETVVDISEDENDSTALWTQIIAFPWRNNFIDPDSISNVIQAYSPSIDTPILFWWNRFSRLLRLEPPDAPRACRGGILAHDMGMGEYAQIVSFLFFTFYS